MTTPSAGALRAAKLWLGTSAKPGKAEQLAAIIDRETNHAALVEAAKAKSGHVIDDKGVERLVLPTSFGSGPFHMTHDGAIIPDSGTLVWSWELADGNRFTGNAVRMKYSTYLSYIDRDTPSYKQAPDGWWRCYSSHEAAALSQEGT